MREMDCKVRLDVGGLTMNSWMRTAVSSYLLSVSQSDEWPSLDTYLLGLVVSPANCPVATRSLLMVSIP